MSFLAYHLSFTLKLFLPHYQQFKNLMSYNCTIKIPKYKAEVLKLFEEQAVVNLSEQICGCPKKKKFCGENWCKNWRKFKWRLKKEKKVCNIIRRDFCHKFRWEKRKQRRRLGFLQNFTASSSRNHSREAKPSYAGSMRPIKRSLGSADIR